MHSRIRLDIHQRDGKRACRGKWHAWQIYGLSTYIIALMYLHIYTYIYIYAEHLGAEIRNAPNAPQAHSCTNTHTHQHTCINMYAPLPENPRAHTYTQVYTYTRIRLHSAQRHTYMHTYTRTTRSHRRTDRGADNIHA